MSDTDDKATAGGAVEGRAAAAPISDAGRQFGDVVQSVRQWWNQAAIGEIDQTAVIEMRREECLLSERYLFMVAMSAGIAVIGLLQSSTAVVIGAMLLSPLMGPIMGLGFALAIGDFQWLKQSLKSLGWGSVMAVTLCALLVFFSPIKTITPEIAARTQPNLFDFLVAFFSGLAGAYAMIRGRADAIVGVAIATALMPPLAVVGFGLAAWNWTVFSGAGLLFITNFVTIALTALLLAKLFGFRSTLSEHVSRLQGVAVFLVVVALVVPLVWSLQRIVWESNAQRIVREEITEEFANGGRLSELEVAFSRSPITVSATMLTPALSETAEPAIERALTTRLGREIDLSLTQFEVGTSSSAAEQAELTSAQAKAQEAASQRVQLLAGRLALIAGVGDRDVTIDSQRRRATVRARRLEGATLAAYRELEARIAATEPEWTVELLPPMSDLPATIGFDEDGPSREGARAIETIIWAAARIELPVVLTGPPEQAAEVAEMLGRKGITVRSETGPGPLRAAWGEISQ